MDRLYTYILLILSTAIGLFNIGYNSEVFDISKSPDSKLYLDIGRSLSNDMGYVNTYNKQEYRNRVVYPPLYPLIIAVIYENSRNPTRVLIYIHLITYVLSVVLLFKVITVITNSKFLSFMSSILFAINHSVLNIFFLVLTECPFFILYILFLYYFIRYTYDNSITCYLYSLLFLSLCAYTRVMGIVLVICVFIVQLLHRKYKRAFISILSVIPCASFYLDLFILTGRGSIGGYLGEFFFCDPDFSRLKLVASEMIFYIPFRLLFYYTGTKVLDFFYCPLIFIGKTTRIDIAGLISLMIWIFVIRQIYTYIQNKQFIIPLVFLFSIIVYVSHTVYTANDPRILIYLLPFFINFPILVISNINNPIFKSTFIAIYCTIYIFTNVCIAYLRVP